jgi:iron complex outermembrane receptor protein
MRKTMWMGAACLAALSGHAAAQEAGAPPSAQGSGIEELVVVGSRASPRLATQSPSPVGVITGDELRARGFSDLTQVLQFLEPSFNLPPVASSPTATGARPATLRGLGPDQVLVLVNGKRRHASAVINSNNGVGRGTVPVDLNSISVESIERIEVLRDGAAAQYGSDALAGVINIVLRGDNHGGELSASAGETSRGDGEEQTLEGRMGFDLGGKGFLTLSGGFRNHDYTNAAAVDPRFGRVTSLLSEPRTRDFDAVANGEYDLGWATAYGFLTLDFRRVAMSPLFRVPSTAPTFYPNGFLPEVVENGYDIGGAVGLRGTVQGWSWDLSDTVGYNHADFDVDNTVNTSLGAASPTSFHGGGARYGQNLVNLTVNRHFDVLAGTDLALGLEQRHENYRMVAGEPASYAGAGAQGFPGFNPPSPVDVSRDAEAAFIDAEISPVKSLTLGAAGRYEHYSDFGDNTTGKLSAIWRPTSLIAVRGTAGTGFRAPSLQQQYYSTVTSQLLPLTGQLANVGNFAATDPVSLALGSSALQPEKSKSYSAGVVLTPAPRFSVTVDAFDIRINDRIVLSENLTGPVVTAILSAHDITNAAAVRFFTNAADTETKGWQAAAHWNTTVLENGRLDLDLGYGSFVTDLRALRTNPVLPTTPLLGPTSIGLLIGGQPRNKITFNAALTKGPWSATLDVTRFGGYHAPPLGVDQLFGSVTTVDVSVTRELLRNLRLQVGVTNLTNQFTDKVIGATDGRIYTEAGGVNWDGRRYFVRMTKSF